MNHSGMFREIRRQMDRAARIIRMYRDAAGEKRPLSKEEKETLRSLGYL